MNLVETSFENYFYEYYTYFCLNAQVWDRNVRAVQLKGVHLDKISKSI